MRTHKLTMVVIGLLAAAGLAACASEEPPLDRVQPNALSKNMFDGEWYMRRTVIDTPYSASATFVGEGNAMHKIQWSIEENFLIARRTYQHVAGVENGGIAGPGVNRTSPIAMYAIQSHFDIRRQYNPSTGEETNVIEENAIDRPWNEREYFRVDWSKNLISDEDTSVTGSLGGVQLEPVTYFVNDPAHPWAPRFEENEAGDVVYMDIVNKYFAKPDMVTAQSSAGLVEIPRCYLISDSHLDCQPAEIAVRSSYMKIDPARDYEPLEYTADRMTRFGYFLTYRDGFDPNYGVTAANRFRFANRHNIWQQSHYTGKDGKHIECLQREECTAAGSGSICDVTWARAKRLSKGMCTIPYREREIRPVAYHLSEGFPVDLVPDAQAMADDWSRALQETIGSLRAIECEETGGTGCDALRTVKEDAFVLCQSPVGKNDNEACGPEGTVARIGDIRFNLLAYVSEPNLASPSGYGPSYPDPETGEIISATAYIYGASMDYLTAYGRDLIALINDDLQQGEVTSNAAYAAWIQNPSADLDAIASGARNPAFAQQTLDAINRHAVDVGADDVDDIDRALTLDWMREIANIRRGTADVPKSKDLIARVKDAKKRIIDSVGELRMGDLGRARLAELKGTKFERMLIDDEHVIAAGFAPGTALTDDVIEKASPLRGMSIESMRAHEDLRRQFQNPPNGCILTASFADDGILGLAREVARKGSMRWHGKDYPIHGKDGKVDYRAVEQMLRHPIFNALAAHEVGHTLGLRHNFVGSFDSVNYHDRYWELRMASNQPSKDCANGVCSRLYDPMTKAEEDGRIREYMYSTVMDYGNNFIVSDAHGIGKYDIAAIKMGYGDLVEVFDAVPEGNEQLIAQIGALSDFGWPAALDIQALDNGEGVRVIPYTEFPSKVGGLEGLKTRSDVRFGTLIDNSGSVSAGIPTSAADMRPTVPYRYCGDEFADYSPECLRYDAGSDVYETVMSNIDTYWNYYIFSNFMRQRLGFNPDSVPARVYSRYFSKLEGANTYYTIFRGIMEDIGATDAFFQAEDGFGPFTAAVGGAYELFGKVLGTPEPGEYARIDERFEQAGSGGGFTSGLVIDNFDGRALRTGYDYGPDSSFFFLTRSGFFHDKALALELLTYSDARVIAQDTTSDVRRYQISYYTSFQGAVSSVMRAAIGNDWETFAPHAVENGGGEMELVYPNMTHHISRNGMGGAAVDPNFAFSLQLTAMVYGMTLMPRTFDQAFVDLARIYVEGGAESVDLDPTVSTVRFVDEDSGLTYVAPSYEDANGNETGVGAQVLMRALELQKAAKGDVANDVDPDPSAGTDLDLWMDNINILRELTWQVGFGAPYRYEP